MSHRSGETEDSFISDLAVASSCPLIKTDPWPDLIELQNIINY